MSTSSSHKSPCILLSSLSAKVALYKEVLSQARAYHMDARVIGVDADENCWGASRVEQFEVLPHLSDLADELLVQILHRLSVTHVLPTRDGELLYWAEKSGMLAKTGIQTWVSSPEALHSCQDKLNFSSTLPRSLIQTIPIFEVPDSKFSQKWVVKERFGSGSRNIALNVNSKEALSHGNSLEEPIYQPFIRGKEFSAECWISARGKCLNVVLRWRELVIGGEAIETTIFHHQEWEIQLKKLFESIAGLHGHCLAQVLVDESNCLWLIEVNPRLGGGSPLVLRAGLNSIGLHLKENGDSGSPTADGTIQYGASLTKRNKDVLIKLPSCSD